MATILIVDDEEMDRVLETAILENAGYHLLYAEDGATALDVCRRWDVDVVITDLAMPTSSGLRFIRELREAQNAVPIIAISGWAKDQLDLAEKYGADFTMSKPIDGEDLLSTVKKALSPPYAPRTKDPWSRGYGSDSA